jgi:hypothetical protein
MNIGNDSDPHRPAIETAFSSSQNAGFQDLGPAAKTCRQSGKEKRAEVPHHGGQDPSPSARTGEKRRQQLISGVRFDGDGLERQEQDRSPFFLVGHVRACCQSL